jgi:hypothetical protein
MRDGSRRGTRDLAVKRHHVHASLIDFAQQDADVAVCILPCLTPCHRLLCCSCAEVPANYAFSRAQLATRDLCAPRPSAQPLNPPAKDVILLASVPGSRLAKARRRARQC